MSDIDTVRKVFEAEESVEIWGNGTAGRDIIHARDVASAAVHAVFNRMTKPLNVGWGRTFTIKEVIEQLVKVSGKNLKITHDLTKPTGDQFRVPDTTRISNSGWVCGVSLPKGLKETYEWYAENGPTKGRFDPYNLGDDK